MTSYDMRRRKTMERSAAYMVPFKRSAEMVAIQTGGVAVEISTPVFVNLPPPRTVGELTDELQK